MGSNLLEKKKQVGSVRTSGRANRIKHVRQCNKYLFSYYIFFIEYEVFYTLQKYMICTIPEIPIERHFIYHFLGITYSVFNYLILFHSRVYRFHPTWTGTDLAR